LQYSVLNILPIFSMLDRMVLLTRDTADLRCDCGKRCVDLWFHLLFGMEEYHVCETNKTENDAQIWFLKIEGGCRAAFLVGAAARSYDDDLLPFQKSPWTVFSIADRLAQSLSTSVRPFWDAEPRQLLAHGRGYSRRASTRRWRLLSACAGELISAAG